MPRISLGNTDLDVFSIVDADSDEAKAFTTYLGYVCSLAELVTNVLGDVDYEGIRQHMEGSGRLRRLHGRRYTGEETPVRGLLANAWLTELHLHTFDANDPGVVRIANHMAPMHAYYSTTRVATAWLQILNGVAPTTHAALLRQLSLYVAGSGNLLPPPWCMTCSQLYPTPCYPGFSREPEAMSNLSRSPDPVSAVGMCLRTTRGREVRALVEETKRQQKRVRAPTGERERRDGAMTPTTVFHFLWRSRTRSNYGDPGMYYMGALGDGDVLAYHRALRYITAGTNFVFETLIAQRAPDLLTNSAAFLITRDRSGLTSRTIEPRLRALGVMRD